MTSSNYYTFYIRKGHNILFRLLQNYSNILARFQAILVLDIWIRSGKIPSLNLLIVLLSINESGLPTCGGRVWKSLNKMKVLNFGFFSHSVFSICCCFLCMDVLSSENIALVGNICWLSKTWAKLCSYRMDLISVDQVLIFFVSARLRSQVYILYKRRLLGVHIILLKYWIIFRCDW